MKLRHLIALLLFAFAACGSAMAQSAAHDTLAFRQVFATKFVADYVKMPVLTAVYRNVSHGNYVKTPSDPHRIEDSESFLTNYTYSTQPDRQSRFIELDNSNICRDIGNMFFPSDQSVLPASALSILCTEVKRYCASYEDKKAEQARLVRALTAFDTLAAQKPIFYADIYNKYGGSVEKYVNTLFRKSILFRESRLESFVDHPTTKKLQADPGVQFVISLALYESWIKDVREGRVKNTLQA